MNRHRIRRHHRAYRVPVLPHPEESGPLDQVEHRLLTVIVEETTAEVMELVHREVAQMAQIVMMRTDPAIEIERMQTLYLEVTESHTLKALTDMRLPSGARIAVTSPVGIVLRTGDLHKATARRSY